METCSEYNFVCYKFTTTYVHPLFLYSLTLCNDMYVQVLQSRQTIQPTLSNLSYVVVIQISEVKKNTAHNSLARYTMYP